MTAGGDLQNGRVPFQIAGVAVRLRRLSEILRGIFMTWSHLLRAGFCALSIAMVGCVANGPDTGTSNSTTSRTLPPAPLPGPTPTPGMDHGTTGQAPGGPATIPITGSYQDRQEAELRMQLEGTGMRIQRNGENVKLILPGNIAFGANSEQIRPNFAAALDNVVAILRKYDKTQIDIRGFTDSTGSFEHNQELSERRAQSVASFLISKQIVASRLRATGYGPRYPIAPNNSEGGRAQNRRVEIELQQR
jgi:outer membrane protein OmpA-like peptidoglycan-associated protein